MIRRPPRSTLSSSSAASDVYKRQEVELLEVAVLDQHQGDATGRHLEQEPVRVPGHEAGPELGAVVTQAVSYTHLRAHETPEHLVCRLLLEKKKNPRKHKV
eukprot:TRINITY_DN20986_c0_g1_i2.p2 TRINITY_DN20986_c0_g1~~TRINITY_DN20986_c0_g1_i2.p2  ORF type:complete len:101 (+),score=31.69 TRINITY_DN20986_c0_g1_i2:133-435(+)